MLSGRWSAALAVVICFSLIDAVLPLKVRAASPTALKPGKCCPVKVNKAGSYILTGNLQPGNANNDAIQVTTSNVTIDLNGYSIIGPSQNTGTGMGVNAASYNNVTVQNGSVSGMAGSGIALGSYGAVRNVTTTGNGTGGSGSGVQIFGGACMVRDSIAGGNASYGLFAPDSTSGYQGNVLNGNGSGSVNTPGPTNMGGNVCAGNPC